MSPAATMAIDEAQRSVLRAADKLFYAHGIGGVVMSDIRDASGVSMRRLYVMYPSKSELVAAWLTDRHDTWMAWFASSVERHVSGCAPPTTSNLDPPGQEAQPTNQSWRSLSPTLWPRRIVVGHEDNPRHQGPRDSPCPDHTQAARSDAVCSGSARGPRNAYNGRATLAQTHRGVWAVPQWPTKGAPQFRWRARGRGLGGGLRRRAGVPFQKGPGSAFETLPVLTGCTSARCSGGSRASATLSRWVRKPVHR